MQPSRFFSLKIRPWGLLTAAGLVASVATILGFLGRFSWFFDLFSHFRVQYMLGLAVLGVLLLLGRRYRAAIACLALACVNLAPVLPLYSRVAARPAQGLPVERAMLINVNTQHGDADRVRAVVSTANPDILVLEEISSRWLSELAWMTNLYPHSIVQPRDDNFGIGLFSRFPLADSEVAYVGGADVPSILATVGIAGTNLRVIATHPLPPAGRDYWRWRNEQLEQIPDHVRSHFPVLLLGDLNVTPWNYHFRRLLARTGLRDSAQGYGVQPTWPNFHPLLRIPIDHCLHSAGIVIVDRRIGAGVSSDHYPLIVDFMIGGQDSRGAGILGHGLVEPSRCCPQSQDPHDE